MHRALANNGLYRFDVGEASVIGTREEQQDAVLLEVRDNCVFAAVCDGMGGLNHGSQASLTAIGKLKELHTTKDEREPYAEFYLRAVDILDESVCLARKKSFEQSATGTTLVSAAIVENRLTWLSVGDSRLYLIRDDEIVCVTTDHNYYLLLNRAYRQGEITSSQYEAEKSKGEALISYIGMGGIDLMDLNDKPLLLRADDVVLLVSDGLYRTVCDSEILSVVNASQNAREITARLIERSQVNAGGSQDNTSIIAIKITGK